MSDDTFDPTHEEPVEPAALDDNFEAAYEPDLEPPDEEAPVLDVTEPEPAVPDIPSGPLYTCAKCNNLVLEHNGGFVNSVDLTDDTCPGTGGAHEVA